MMKFYHAAAPIAAAVALLAGVPAAAQTSTETKVSTTVKDGVATKKVKVTHVRKHKTHHVKKILGVKVGHKTVTHKTVKETTTSSDGTSSTTVKTK